MSRTNARPGWGAGGRAQNHRSSAGENAHSHLTPVILVGHKPGRGEVFYGKIVPLEGRFVLATPFGNRVEVSRFPSIPPTVLELARDDYRCERWVLQFRRRGHALEFPLGDVERVGHLKTSCG